MELTALSYVVGEAFDSTNEWLVLPFFSLFAYLVDSIRASSKTG
jgi:hypothetical protein